MTDGTSPQPAHDESEAPVYLLSMHVTHAWVDIDQLELVAANEARSTLHRLYEQEPIDEAAILKTCNRVEVYVATREPLLARLAMERLLGPADHGDASLFRYFAGEETARHLLRVAAGIDSLIVGENEILGQVRRALEFARQERTIGPTLSFLFEKALHVGKRARRETAVSRGAVSVGSAAVSLAQKLLGGLTGRTVGIVGAGEIALLVAKALVDHEIRAVLVANRTPTRALEVAQALKGEVVPYERMKEVLQRADVVIVATSSPHVVLTPEELRSAARPAGNPLLLIDLGLPRNIDPDCSRIPDVRLESLEGLRTIAAENLAHRKEEVQRVERIIDAELGRYLEKIKLRDAEMLLRDVYEGARRVREEELQRAIARLRAIGEVSTRQEEILRDLVNAVVNKILAPPTLSLKAASKRGDRGVIEGARKLFQFEPGEGERAEAEDEL